MRNQTAPTVKKEGIFFYLLLLTGFFILLEISFFIQCNKAYLSDFTLVSNKLSIPLAILPGIFYFLTAQIFVHFSYCVLVWLLTVLIAKLFTLSPNQQLRLAFYIWLSGLVTVLITNQYFFPNSKFSELTAIIFFNRGLLRIIFIFLLINAASIFLLAVLSSIRFFPRAFCSALIIIASLALYHSRPLPVKDAATESKPNIIIIGIDSLRPDFLSYFGHDKRTPFLDSLLEQSTVFNEAVTPLARTFPAWMAILTGQYPKSNGIRSDLAKQDKLHQSEMLSTLLQRQGYETIFATDETRFSNIDTKAGFDQLISPPIGLNDFLIGTFNDFPLSNLIVNTPIGKWLFPYSYANRPAHFIYEPDSFLQLVRPALLKQREQPLFFVIHFCLPHTPYLWSDFYAEGLSAVERYEATVLRMDQQLNDFFSLLQQAKLLEHAIVVVLSDHGEALELPGDRITEKELYTENNTRVPKFYPPMLDNESINQSAGHGTDVLGLPQYHTLLSFKWYGARKQRIGDVGGVVSLVDIKSTLLDFLNLPFVSHNSSSLRGVIEGDSITTAKRHIFLESDFSPEAVRTVYPETRKVLLEGIELFQIDPITTRLFVKDSMSKMIIQSKQYADIYDGWMLALYPQNQHYQMPILINLYSGRWTNNLQSSFAKNSPANEMYRALREFYGAELK